MFHLCTISILCVQGPPPGRVAPSPDDVFARLKGVLVQFEDLFIQLGVGSHSTRGGLQSRWGGMSKHVSRKGPATYTHAHAYAYRKRVHIHMQVCIHTHLRVRMHRHTRIHTQMQAYMNMYRDVQTYTPTHAHAHAHTRMPASEREAIEQTLQMQPRHASSLGPKISAKRKRALGATGLRRPLPGIGRLWHARDDPGGLQLHGLRVGMRPGLLRGVAGGVRREQHGGELRPRLGLKPLGRR